MGRATDAEKPATRVLGPRRVAHAEDRRASSGVVPRADMVCAAGAGVEICCSMLRRSSSALGHAHIIAVATST